MKRLPLTFSQFRSANVERCEESFHKLKDWSPSDWMTAFVGEVGEAANEIKKLKRLESPLNKQEKRSPEEIKKAIAKELADAFTYLDLTAAALDIDLERAVIEKFNEVSERVGSNIEL